MTGFVGVVPSALEDVSVRHGLTFAEKAVLVALVLLADYRTAEYPSTIRSLAERLGLHEANLRPKLKRLSEFGLIKYDFKRGYGGRITVLCYCDVVHLGRGRNARSLRSDHGERGGDDSSATRGSRVADARITRSDLHPPVWSAARGPGDFQAARDTVSSPHGADAPQPRDWVA